MSIKKTTANGNTLKLYSHRPQSDARAFSRAVGRNHPAISQISTAGTPDVKVTLTAGESVPTPDGWEIVRVYRGTNGTTYVGFDKEARA